MNKTMIGKNLLIWVAYTWSSSENQSLSALYLKESILVMSVQNIVNCAWRKNVISFFEVLQYAEKKIRIGKLNVAIKVNIYFEIRHQTESFALRTNIYSVEINGLQTCLYKLTWRLGT